MNRPTNQSITVTAIGDAISPALALIIACCRWPPSAVRVAAMRTGAAAITDWDDFLLQIDRQRVAGLVDQALSATAIELPPAVAEKLATRALGGARRNIALAAETVRLQRALDAAGIRALALKGAALAQLAYGSFTVKMTRDIDLLVAPQQAEAALSILEREGYVLWSPARQMRPAQRRALIRYGREVELIHRDHKWPVELQWRAADNAQLLRSVNAQSRARSVALVGGSSVRTLAANDLFAYLCVHGARHSWSRLKWIADLNALLAADITAIPAFYRHARNIGAGLCAGQALLLCQRLLALPLPADVTDEISADRRAQKLAAIALAAMRAPHADSGTTRSVGGMGRYVYTQFLLGRGWAFFAAQCRATLVVPADVVHCPLPPFLQFLYPLLRLPLWLRRRAIANAAGIKIS